MTSKQEEMIQFYQENELGYVLKMADELGSLTDVLIKENEEICKFHMAKNPLSMSSEELNQWGKDAVKDLYKVRQIIFFAVQEARKMRLGDGK